MANMASVSDANANFSFRQPYHYHTIIRVGERDLDVMTAVRIDWASRKKKSQLL